MDQELLVKGFAALGAGYFIYMVARHGIGWVLGKLGTWWTAGKADVLALETRVSALEAVTPSVAKPTAATGPTGAAAQATTQATTQAQIVALQARLNALEATVKAPAPVTVPAGGAPIS